MTIIAIALIAIGLLVTIVIFIRKPAEHRRAHVTVAELQARLADESGPEHARAEEPEATEESGAAATDSEPEAQDERDPTTTDAIGQPRTDEETADADQQARADAAEQEPADTGRQTLGDTAPVQQPAYEQPATEPSADDHHLSDTQPAEDKAHKPDAD
ncbi:hypothetical protein FEK35_07395 [Nocardia cyriacigeorgica]|uniref:Uncharacterized protein n=1 Tax=Nocardia cyriacigeorgica TaxID=135487 RepID=A0A5R8PGJ8_9NOCA|nr:hypothetical protein [Nocardia cyriacigeorgica]TLG14233.1 hypothetical protein FEK35_07395 [Nocardia cyriacigeorgica]